MEDVRSTLAELVALVEDARSMPMSASCVVNRGDVLALLTALDAALPRALEQARAVLGDQEGVVEQGRHEAQRIVAEAREERLRMLADTEVLAEARATADAMRREVDDYVDGKLANFEIVLTKTLSAVERGRRKLAGKHELDELAQADEYSGGFLDQPLSP